MHSKIDKRGSIGYWLAENFQGNGIITKSCNHIIGSAFRQLGLHRIEIRVAGANKKSAAIPERLGFKKEGHLKGALFRNKNHVDMVIYGITAPDWK